MAISWLLLERRSDIYQGEFFTPVFSAYLRTSLGHRLLLREMIPAGIDTFLEPYLPQENTSGRPFITLTYAQSLDSRISASPGTRTAISHIETKQMTQFLRSKHDGILVGIGTVLADNPGLNCKLGSAIRPIIIDPHFRIKAVYGDLKIAQLAATGEGLDPIVVMDRNQRTQDNIEWCEKNRILAAIVDAEDHLPWEDVFYMVSLYVKSIMVEGGASVINQLLETSLVDSLVVTIGPIYLGTGGVQVSPAISRRLVDGKWWAGQQDAVVAARLQ